MMVNKRRGEAEYVAPDGKTYTLVLKIGTLAEIEEQFGCKSLLDLGVVFSGGLSVLGTVKLFCILCAAGGNELAEADVMDWPGDIQGLSDAILDCIGPLIAGDAPDEGDDVEGNAVPPSNP